MIFSRRFVPVLLIRFQVVKKQQETDEKLLKLVKTMVEVYSFVDEVDFIPEKIKRLEESLLGIARETVECAIFIHEYMGHGFSGRLFE
jgi:hypothetical protein